MQSRVSVFILEKLNYMQSQASKQCPFCAEVIKDEAIKCKHCGADLTAKASSFKLTKSEKPKEGLFLQTMNCGCAIIFLIVFIVIVLVAMN